MEELSHGSIEFSQRTESIGRNGMLITTGLYIHKNLWNNGETVSISPVTSKGLVGKCSIEIPTADIPQLINELKRIEAKNDNQCSE
jgi:hypothetical protein